jgi:hypothetical protein
LPNGVGGVGETTDPTNTTDTVEKHRNGVGSSAATDCDRVVEERTAGLVAALEGCIHRRPGGCSLCNQEDEAQRTRKESG